MRLLSFSTLIQKILVNEMNGREARFSHKMSIAPFIPVDILIKRFFSTLYSHKKREINTNYRRICSGGHTSLTTSPAGRTKKWAGLSRLFPYVR
ncbi:hypothetical protein Y032_0004g2015 [Ancylostoma ceylanicum]|uniref:Uncharacterized protein n=1 Tax=Ancylostoma ceylanicum TaxID=53326 RepID=A0A016VVY3_9BILA|nr:hypothetical protein Y032_0004g2015 [Ancylostoma ceylanicum]